ncbi:MAG: ATP-binding cassette domain-containing protein [Bacteroidota bacterium]
MLRVEHLRKEYSTVVAVDDVSFALEKGAIFGLLGPNGAGKTTTIRMILDIIKPDRGTISFDGRPFSEQTRNRVGYLPEERGLYRKSRLLDTILYFAGLRGMAHGEARKEAIQWLERFGLADQTARRVQELSRGNQQKVQFISSIIHRPELVVLDEPFSGLDPVNQIVFKDVMQELKQLGRAIVFSTHQMDQAERLSDSLCLIDRGKVVLSGTVRDVKKRHGMNSLHLEFDGDGTFLPALPGVDRAILYENSAELNLTEGARIQDIVERINRKVDLRKLELREPSLHSIFVQTVGHQDEHPHGEEDGS